MQSNGPVVELVLVEDNLEDAELILRALKKHKLTNNITVLRDGAEALEYLFPAESGGDGGSGPRPRVILLDLKLPKVDGIEVLRQLKSDENTKSIPVVVLTSSREDKDLQMCYELGVNSYIVKPVDFEGFIRAVSEVGLYWALLNQPPY